jgi:hypothetical protein
LKATPTASLPSPVALNEIYLDHDGSEPSDLSDHSNYSKKRKVSKTSAKKNVSKKGYGTKAVSNAKTLLEKIKTIPVIDRPHAIPQTKL